MKELTRRGKDLRLPGAANQQRTQEGLTEVDNFGRRVARNKRNYWLARYNFVKLAGPASGSCTVCTMASNIDKLLEIN